MVLTFAVFFSSIDVVPSSRIDDKKEALWNFPVNSLFRVSHRKLCNSIWLLQDQKAKLPNIFTHIYIISTNRIFIGGILFYPSTFLELNSKQFMKVKNLINPDIPKDRPLVLCHNFLESYQISIHQQTKNKFQKFLPENTIKIFYKKTSYFVKYDLWSKKTLRLLSCRKMVNSAKSCSPYKNTQS